MRDLNIAMLFFIMSVSGCFDSLSGSDGDLDGGFNSVPESGIDDSARTKWGNTDGSVAPLDARIAADRRLTPADPPDQVCGNNVKEEGELCDGTVLPCPDGAFGEIRCDIYCLSYEDYCLRDECGNNVWNEWEQCDGNDFRGESCLSLTGQDGTLDCTEDCRFDTSMCYDKIGVVDDGGVDD